MSLERRLGLRDDETILSLTRRAPITLAIPFMLSGMCILAPLVFLLPLLKLGTLGKVAAGLVEAAGWAWITYLLQVRQASVLAVTDRRVIVAERHGLFDRHVTELPYASMQRVSYRIRGFWATVCRYGSLVLESAGSQEALVIERVARPERVHDLIDQLRQGGQDGFGRLLHSVSGLDARQLGLLKAEVDRAVGRLSPDQRP